VESHKDINIEKIKQQHHHHQHHPHRKYRSSLNIIENILKFASTVPSVAYEQLTYYREITIVKGLIRTGQNSLAKYRLALKGERGKPLPAALEIQNKPGATEKKHTDQVWIRPSLQQPKKADSQKFNW
jgi:hypothetical protein